MLCQGNAADTAFFVSGKIGRIALSVLGVLGTVFSFTTHSNTLFTIALIIATILAIISTIDTVSVGKRFLVQFLEKKANQYETKVRENKLKEYNSLTQSEKSE